MTKKRVTDKRQVRKKGKEYNLSVIMTQLIKLIKTVS